MEATFKMKKGNRCVVADNPQLMTEWDNEKNVENNLFADTTSIGSHKTAYWVCAKHKISFSQVIRARATGERACPVCKDEWRKNISRERYIQGKKTLAETHPQLVKEWVKCDNPKFTPETCVATSNVKVSWKCPKCGGQYDAYIFNRTRQHSGCPYCAGQKVLKGFNDLQTLLPDLAREWSPKNSLLPTEVTLHSKKKVYWCCPFGHDDYFMAVQNRVKRVGCPICASQSQTSFPEQALFFYLSKVYPTAINRYFCNSKEIDIFIPSLNVGIEYNGYFSHKKKSLKDLDKKRLFESMGIKMITIKEYKKVEEMTDSDYYIHERTSYKRLDTLIQSILADLCDKTNSDNIDINCSRDSIKIKQQYVTLRKEKSIAALRPDLLSRWDYEKNGNITPDLVSLGTGHRYYWKCYICGRSYLALPSQIATGSACSKHSYLVKTGVNDFETVYPELLKYWDYEKNEILPSQVYAGGDKVVFWLCEKGHSFQKSLRKRIKNEGCPICAGKKVLAGYNDLESQYPEVAATWNYSKNNGILPSEVVAHSNKEFFWKCSRGHEWKAKVSNRTKRNGTGCPYCSNTKVLPGDNDLKTKYPHIAIEWNYDRNANLPEHYFPFSSKKVWWKCKYGHEWEATIANRTYFGTNCPTCYKLREEKSESRK